MTARSERRHQSDAAEDQRSRFERDRDRILYSSHFRRLAGITQVISPDQLHVVHNRLTHSLEVAQIARRLAQNLTRTEAGKALAEYLGGIDPDVVETAALAHDLGHPPFGHIAEHELDDSIKRLDGPRLEEGFNGNAQAFRILTKLSVRKESFPGLNLTRASLNAVLKYPNFRSTSGTQLKHWGAYSTERDDFDWARTGELPGVRSIEAEIIDWADDVAYAVHDLEDFIRAGLIPIDRLSSGIDGNDEIHRFVEKNIEHFNEKEITKDEAIFAFASVFGVLTTPGVGIYRGTRRDRADLRTSTSNLIRYYIDAFRLNKDWPRGKRRMQVDRDYLVKVEVLKRLTWFYVIDSPSLALQQQGHRRIIRFLFTTLFDAAESSERNWTVFPESHRERLMNIKYGTDEMLNIDAGLEERLLRMRLIVDFTSSMTEAQAIEIYTRLGGSSSRSVLETVTL